jgi:hypothetical protein
VWICGYCVSITVIEYISKVRAQRYAGFTRIERKRKIRKSEKV